MDGDDCEQEDESDKHAVKWVKILRRFFNLVCILHLNFYLQKVITNTLVYTIQFPQYQLRLCYVLVILDL